MITTMNHRTDKLLPILVALLASAGVGADWEGRVTDDVGVEVTYRQAPVVTARYVFWAENWKFAGARMRLEASPAGRTTFTGSVQALDLTLNGTVTSPEPNRLRYVWNMEAGRELSGIIGGGLEFRLVLDSPAVGRSASEPELLDGNKGWTWDLGADGPITVEFDPPIDSVYFERGQKHTIRAMIMGGDLKRGRHTMTMTVTLPRGGGIAQTLAQRYGPADTSDWFGGALLHDKSPVDVSFLNHRPAGKHGFVQADSDRLVFEDGSEARFWGGNIAAYAIFSDKEQIEAQARRIAQLGYNLMRVHHHDSTRWVGRTVIDKDARDTQRLDAEVMDRLDYWIKCLKDQGVYVWLDLHVGRLFKEGDAIGQGFQEMLRHGGKPGQGTEGKGYCYFNQRVEELMKDFNQKYLDHVNRYTGLAYKEDPAVMGLLVTNENDVTCHFGNLMLPDKNNPYHNRLFDDAVRAFAEKHQLPYQQTGRTWEPGPSKLFLADWEYRWNRRMIDHLGQLSVRVPVSTTQMWGGMNMCGLPSLTAGGIIDVHSYGQAEALSVNPRYNDNYVTYMATGQAYGMPVAITEWNVPYPAVDRFTAPLYVASIAALQGWDAPMIYNYSQRTFEPPTRPGTWSTFPDPALTGLMPAAALAYRQGHVRPAVNTYCLMFDRETLFFEGSHPKSLAALRTLVEQSRVTIGLPETPELDWLVRTEPAGSVKRITGLDRDFLPAGQDFVRSDTGQLIRNWVTGAQAINTDGTQAVHGWMGAGPVKLGDVTFRVQTPKAALAVSSLDSKPIRQSRRLLITAVARVVASEGGRMPLLSEPVRGELQIRAPEGLKLVPLAGDGTHLEPVPARFDAGRYVVNLPAPRGTHWFLLTAGASQGQ